MRLMLLSPSAGGGKTTVALHLSIALVAEGEPVELTDQDPRKQLSAALSAFSGTSGEGVPRLTADSDSLPLEEVRDIWSITDPAPGWNDALADSLRAADMILCPVQPEPESMAALSAMAARLNAESIDISKLRLLVTRYSNRLERHRELRGELTKTYGSQLLLPVVIRASSRLSDAVANGEPLRSFAPRSTAASDFNQLARALVAMRSLSRPKGP